MLWPLTKNDVFNKKNNRIPQAAMSLEHQATVWDKPPAAKTLLKPPSFVTWIKQLHMFDLAYGLGCRLETPDLNPDLI